MLIVHRLSAAGYRYYLDAVGPSPGPAPSLGEAPGRWWGDGANVHGLSGDVARADLRRALPSGRGRVPGFDLTFAAPKSISVLHGVTAEPVAAALRAAHDAAVEAGLRYLERHAGAVRTRGGLVPCGLTVAAFRHRVSRADDPHLHTHALVANAATVADGRVLALHSPLLYGERRAASAVYHAVLRYQAASRLGLTWEPAASGRADTDAVPATVRNAFSRRQAAVLAGSVADPGTGSWAEGSPAQGRWAERRWAARVTRPERDGLVDMDELRESWLRRCRDLGWEPPELDVRRRGVVLPTTDEAMLPAADRWTRGDLLTAMATAWRSGAPESVITDRCEVMLRSPAVRAAGRSPCRNAGPRFTTPGAAARRASVDLRIAEARTVLVDDAPGTLDHARRRQSTEGRRTLIVAADARASESLADRTGARAVPVALAAEAVAQLAAGDLVVLVRADRLDSALVAPVLHAAGERGVTVAAPPAAAAVTREVPTLRTSLTATVDVPGGDLTVAPTADGCAAAALEDWLSTRRAGGRCVLVVPAGEAAAMEVRARAALRSAGLLGTDEVGGLAAGDVVRFTATRPSLGVRRHETAEVVAVDPSRAQVTMRLPCGDVEVGAGRIGNLPTAHAVPPVPALVGGRGDTFIVGAVVGSRHIDGAVHRYVTVDAPDVPTVAALDRRATLTQLEAHAAACAPDPIEAGRRRRHELRLGAARAWVSQAEERHRRALDDGDRTAQASWLAQLSAARCELAELRVGENAPRAAHLSPHGSAVNDQAPEHARAIDAQVALRSAALARARDLGAELAPGDVPARGRRPARFPVLEGVALGRTL